MKYVIFSKRQQRLKGELPDMEQSESIPKELRVQIFFIWEKVWGKVYYNDFGHLKGSQLAMEAYSVIKDTLCEEYGVLDLGEGDDFDGEGDDSYWVVRSFFFDTKYTDKAIDVIELSFRYIDSEIREKFLVPNDDELDEIDKAFRISPRDISPDAISPDEAINLLDQRFDEHSVSYQYESGLIVKVDSQGSPSEVVKPAEELSNNRMSSPKVFLSYVIENRDSIEQLDRELTDYGIDVVTDYKYVCGGDNWKNRIRTLIYESGYFIPCFSKEFNEREESVAYRELDYAIERASDFPPDRKWIIPVKINECTIPNWEIRPGVMLTNLNWTDLFPNTKWDDGVKGIVKALGIEPVSRSVNVSPTTDIEPVSRSVNVSSTTKLRKPMTSTNVIRILQDMGFDMRKYTPIDPFAPNALQGEYWSQSDWFIVSPEKFPKLPNYITAIAAGNREGILSEIRLSLSINDHSDKDNAYDSLTEKCNQLCIELCESSLSDAIRHDLNQSKNSFMQDKKIRAHTIYTDTDYCLEGLNINMQNQVYNQSTTDEKPVRFGFHITRFSFIL